jgi:hypothetical protein
MVKQRPVAQTGHSAATASALRPSGPIRVGDSAMKVLCLVDGLATAEVDRTCVLLWRKVVTESRFQIQREAIEYVAEHYPGEASILCVIEPTSEPPPQALREAASALLTRLAPQLRCVAYVIEGSGFRAATIRGVLSGIERLRPNAYSTRYFANVGQAAAWIGVQNGTKSMSLVDAAHRLRARMDAVYTQPDAPDSEPNSVEPSSVWPPR